MEELDERFVDFTERLIYDNITNLIKAAKMIGYDHVARSLDNIQCVIADEAHQRDKDKRKANAKK